MRPETIGYTSKSLNQKLKFTGLGKESDSHVEC